MMTNEYETTLRAELSQYAEEQKARGVMPPLLSLEKTHQLAARVACQPLQVELLALRMQILPQRYRRNLGTVGWEGQARLLESTVAIVGAGGLGGWIIEGLARMGIGRLIIIDGDRFEENNLNRQLGCTEESLGRHKTQCLAERVGQVNGAVHVTPLIAWLDADNAQELIKGAHVVVDALDTMPARLLLQDAAAACGVPMVHGAIGGYTGQVMTILPGDAGLRAIYGDGPVPDRGVEVELGNPSATPMMISAWQIQEVVKILLDQGELLRHRILFLDAESGDVTEIRLA